MEKTRRPPAKYYQALGLNPDARASDVAAAYYHLRVQLRMDGATGARREQLDHDFRILRSYFLGKRVTHRTGLGRRTAAWKRGIGLASIFLSLGFALVLVLPKVDTPIRYEPGDVLYWKEDSSRFGVVVGYDPAYRFRVGGSVPAYQVHLADSTASVWISRRRVERGMRRGETFP